MPNIQSRITKKGEGDVLRPESVMITGANRGLGLELVIQFSRLPHPPKFIFATCRDPDSADKLTALAANNSSIIVMKLDVTDHASYPDIVARITSLVQGRGLNLLINNAGIPLREDSELETVTAERMREGFETNALAPLMLSQACLGLLMAAASTWKSREMSCSKAAIINVTSQKGSCSSNVRHGQIIAKSAPGTKVGNFVGGRYPYRISKAALNMITTNMAANLELAEILVVAVNPGWVRTSIGGPNAPLCPQESVAQMLGTMGALDDTRTGCFVDYKGAEMQW